MYLFKLKSVDDRLHTANISCNILLFNTTHKTLYFPSKIIFVFPTTKESKNKSMLRSIFTGKNMLIAFFVPSSHSVNYSYNDGHVLR